MVRRCLAQYGPVFTVPVRTNSTWMTNRTNAKENDCPVQHNILYTFLMFALSYYISVR
jgi:branched-subunit amino acid permease